jgi:hypothetical protein
MKRLNKITARQFVDSGKHLLPFLQDFHDQKDVFKWLSQFLNNAQEKDTKDGKMRLEDMPNWASAHIYTIDFFLWYMGMAGYTLQRSRSNVDFLDLDAQLEQFKRMKAKAFADMMDQYRAEKASQASEPKPNTEQQDANAAD